MPLTADDRWQIRELADRFENAYDDADLDAWLATWTPDGVMDQGEMGGTTAGTDALRQWFQMFQKTFYGKRHVMSNHVVSEVAGASDQASMRSYLTVLERDRAPMVWGTARWDDDLVAVNGQWLFRRRVQTFDGNNMSGAGAYLFS